MLKKIIVEVSEKNATSDLAEYLPWEQGLVLLKDLTTKESSFIDYCTATFQQQLQKNSTSIPAEPPPALVNNIFSNRSLPDSGSGNYSGNFLKETLCSFVVLNEFTLSDVLSLEHKVLIGS